MEKKRGPKSKFNPEFHPKLIQYMAKAGLTDEQMADELGVARSTFSKWKLDHPELGTELKDWKIEADNRVERSLYERATGYEHPETKFFMYEGSVIAEPTIKHYPPDTTAAIFWLKNRKPEQWREKQPDEPDDKGAIKIIIQREGNNGNTSDAA